MISRYVFVEDTYGVDFHRFLLEKLIVFDEELLREIQGRMPVIRRLPAKKCNPAIAKKVRAVLFGQENWKMLVVIDTENRKVNESIDSVRRHFKRSELKRTRLVTVHPRHEAWLCMGIGGDKKACRNDPESVISRLIRRRYEKYMLSSMANRVDIRRLLGENDFQKYVSLLKWLVKDP